MVVMVAGLTMCRRKGQAVVVICSEKRSRQGVNDSVREPVELILDSN